MSLLASATARANTLIVYINPTTWAIVTPFGGDPTASADFWDTQATYVDQYGVYHYRYYTGGIFDTVIIENSTSDHTIRCTLSPCHNIFYIDRSVPFGYTCSNGYNGTGEGTVGEVNFGTALSNGDFLIGGNFTGAGGYPYTSYFSCYQWNNGWSGVNGVYASARVTGFTWNGNYQLQVRVGNGNYVYGPLSSGGSSGTVYPGGVNDYVLWNNYNKTFAQGWWSQ